MLFAFADKEVSRLGGARFAWRHSKIVQRSVSTKWGALHEADGAIVYGALLWPPIQCILAIHDICCCCRPTIFRGESSVKLMLKREQKAQTGLFGGHKGMSFILTARLELTSAEQALVKTYKMEGHEITVRSSREGGQEAGIIALSLMSGHIQELADVALLLENERVIKSGCKQFKLCST